VGLEGSLLRRDNREQFYGFQTSVAGNFHRNAGIVVDFGYQYNHLDDQRFDVYEFLFGPQLNMRGNRAAEIEPMYLPMRSSELTDTDLADHNPLLISAGATTFQKTLLPWASAVASM
jgi:hypothetical protein